MWEKYLTCCPGLSHKHSQWTDVTELQNSSLKGEWGGGVHRCRKGREKPNQNKPFPGSSQSSRNLRTEEMSIFGLSDSDRLKWIKHFRDSGMANSHRMTWPFQGHPIELGPCMLEEPGYGYQCIISLLLSEKTGIISIRAWAIKAQYLRRGWKDKKPGKGSHEVDQMRVIP